MENSCYRSDINTIGILDQKGSLLENLVAIELLRRSEMLFYYTTKNNFEVDFLIISKDTKRHQLFQVCNDPSNPATRQREERSFLQSMTELKLEESRILTFDYELSKSIKNKTIFYLLVWKWLL